MSTQAKLFIILSKQTVSWTACQGGSGWCVRSVRAASNTAAWPPSLFLLSLLLITPYTQASSPCDYRWSYTSRYRGIRGPLKRSHVFVSEPCDIFSTSCSFSLSSAYSFHLRSTDQACCGSSLSGICKCMCEYTLVLCGPMLHVCAFMSSMWRGGSVGCGGGCIWTLRSSLISLSHPQSKPASLGVSINNKSL